MKLKAVVIALGTTLAVPNALAGECPADKQVPDGQGQKMVSHAAKGVTDVVRSTTDLAKEPVGVPGRLFRLRELNVAPGDDLHRYRRDRRVREQLRGADRAPGR